jgi:hypothetical protein
MDRDVQPAADARRGGPSLSVMDTIGEMLSELIHTRTHTYTSGALMVQVASSLQKEKETYRTMPLNYPT